LDNISTTLLYEILIEIGNIIKRLESKDIEKNLNSLKKISIPAINVMGRDQKMKKGIQWDLTQIIKLCKKSKPTRKKNETIYEIIDICELQIEMLSEEYPKKTRTGKDVIDLFEKDRVHLIEIFLDMQEELNSRVEYSEIILNLNPKQNLDVDKKSLKILDKSAKEDLEEGLALLQLGHTTSAYMIFMRVAEFLVQQYYKKITGHYPKNDDAAWGQMLFSLQNDYKSKIDKNFANLLYYLKDKRNEAQHPGKRFNEKDCNKLITYLTEYVDYFAKKK